MTSSRLAPEWLSWPGTRALLAAFAASGEELRFVGGAVRDALPGLPVEEVDAATPATPERVIALLEAAKLKAIPTGLAHGTVTALAHGKSFEITTLRKDVATDGRHAEVAFTDDWRADAARRDFTMNALYLSSSGELLDYFGGVTDMEARRIRFIGDAAARIEEDYLRILRFFRFLATHGQPPADAEALAACSRLKDGLAGLSGERIRQEMFKLLAARDPLYALEQMEATGVLASLGITGWPQAREALGHLIALERSANPSPSLQPSPRGERELCLSQHRDGVPSPHTAPMKWGAVSFIMPSIPLTDAGREKARMKGMAQQIQNSENNSPLPLLRLSLLLRGAASPADAAKALAERWKLARAAARLLTLLVVEPPVYPAAPASLKRHIRRLGREEALLLALRDAAEAHIPADDPALAQAVALILNWDIPVFPVSGDNLIARGLSPGPELGKTLRILEDYWEEQEYQPDREALVNALDNMNKLSN